MDNLLLFLVLLLLLHVVLACVALINLLIVCKCLFVPFLAVAVWLGFALQDLVQTSVLSAVMMICGERFPEVYYFVQAARQRARAFACFKQVAPSLSSIDKFRQDLDGWFFCSLVVLRFFAGWLIAIDFKTTVMVSACCYTALELATLAVMVMHETSLWVFGRVLQSLLESTNWNPFLDMHPDLYVRRCVVAVAARGSTSKERASWTA
ncbi:hypothetical protein LTR08_004392 [Meristemomyces frigidus]|nr:hypothetical protein LTR08_004392 [Meristemomyces frigidus]